MVAAREGKLKIIKTINEKFRGGEDNRPYYEINKKSKDGWTALMYASISGYNLIITYLVKNCDANVEICDKFGRNALHWASRYNNVKVVEKLLELKVPFQKADEEGQTPWQLARIYSSNLVEPILRSAAMCDEKVQERERLQEEKKKEKAYK